MRRAGKTKTAFRYAVTIADSLLFSVLLFLPLHTILHLSEQPLIALFLLLGISGIILAARMKRIVAEKRKRAEKAMRQKEIDRLFLMSDESLSKRIGAERFMLVRRQNPDRIEILETIRKGADGIGLLTKNPALTDMIHQYAPQMPVYDAEEILHMIKPGYEHHPRERSGLRINKYLLLGVLFLIISFVLRYKIYYRIISCLCLFFASISGAFGASGIRRKLDDIS